MPLTFSIVSHGQADLIRHLFADLRRLALSDITIILTLNLVEDEDWLEEWQDLSIRLIRNPRPLGFGANHNQAFALSEDAIFCVVNPDIRLPDTSFMQLVREFDQPGIGGCAPRVVGPDRKVQDNVRRFPTFVRLIRRVLLRQRHADYAPDMVAQVNWAAGMFVMFYQDAFAQVGGFDERYFMYLEDADICRRLGAAGWTILYQPAVTVIHDAQRASHRDWRHLRWHMRSMIRFLIRC